MHALTIHMCTLVRPTHRPLTEQGLYGCHGQGGSQAFMYLRKSNELRPVENLELCITAELTMASCEQSKNAAWEHLPCNHSPHACMHAILALHTDKNHMHNHLEDKP